MITTKMSELGLDPYSMAYEKRHHKFIFSIGFVLKILRMVHNISSIQSEQIEEFLPILTNSQK